MCKPGDDAGKGKSRDFPHEEEVEKEEEVEEEEEKEEKEEKEEAVTMTAASDGE